jgi:hypothetical protein
VRFDEEDRRTYARLADVLIPAKDQYPSASQAGVAGVLLDVVLRSRPDLSGGLRGVLSSAKGQDPSEFVFGLEKEDPEAFGVLTILVRGAYFMNPTVRRLFGYRGQLAEPIDYEARPEYLEDDILQPVIQRGPIYRPTPGLSDKEEEVGEPQG